MALVVEGPGQSWQAEVAEDESTEVFDVLQVACLFFGQPRFAVLIAAEGFKDG